MHIVRYAPRLAGVLLSFLFVLSSISYIISLFLLMPRITYTSLHVPPLSQQVSHIVHHDLNAWIRGWDSVILGISTFPRRKDLLESEPATITVALPVITRVRKGSVARAQDKVICTFAGPPALRLCLVILRREGVVGLGARLWNWDRLRRRGGREN